MVTAKAPVAALAVPVPSTVLPLLSYSVTVLPGSAVPLIFACEKLVMPSPGVPLSVVESSARPVGADGVAVSIRKVPAGL